VIAAEVRALLTPHGAAEEVFAQTRTGSARTLLSGTRLGPYEVVSLIGAGGIGEVYAARDTPLDIRVAVKVLPRDVAGDPDECMSASSGRPAPSRIGIANATFRWCLRGRPEEGLMDSGGRSQEMAALLVP
jgi:serine/threonine protein kinase